jgi:hypothetical protein
MKKLLLAILALYALSGISYAVNFGIGIKGGVGQNDPKTMKQLWNYYGGTITKAPGILSIELFSEDTLPYDSEMEIMDFNKVGFKIGYDSYGKNKLKTSSLNAEESTFAVPITAYLKEEKGVREFSSYIGAGTTIIKTKAKLAGSNFTKNKWFAHIALGTEYLYTENISIGIDVKININASVKMEGYTLSNRSGFQGAGVIRFYF